jgi:hypothetical protein
MFLGWTILRAHEPGPSVRDEWISGRELVDELNAQQGEVVLFDVGGESSHSLIFPKPGQGTIGTQATKARTRCLFSTFSPVKI